MLARDRKSAGRTRGAPDEEDARNRQQGADNKENCAGFPSLDVTPSIKQHDEP